MQFYYENLIKPKKLETRKIFINTKSYTDLVIYFTRYHHVKSTTKLNLYYQELIGKIEEYERKKYMTFDGYALDKVLDNIKRIRIEKLRDIRILIHTDAKLPNDITLKNAVILATYVIKDGDKFYSQLFLEKV